MSNSNFSAFTNQYSLSKTLRFELKPVGETQRMLEEASIFEEDETIQKKYEATKPFFDKLHREFVKEAFQDAVLSELSGYLEIFKKWKNDKKAHEKELQKKESALRKEIGIFFDAHAKIWAQKYSGLKNKNIEILFEEAVFEKILKERFQGEEGTEIANEATGEKISIFGSWKGFTGYFGKFFETRKNFYKDDGTSSAISTRMIDQNLKRFCDNILIYEKIKEKVNFAEVEQIFGKSLSEIFSLEFYNSCLLQNGIDFYNKILGGETKENGEKVKGLNECINKFRQDHKGEKLQFFKPLDKQILSEKEKVLIDEIKDDDDLLETLQQFQKNSSKKITILRNLFGDFVNNQEKYNLSEIYLSRESLNTIAHKWTGETEKFEESLYLILKNAKQDSLSAKKKDTGYSFPDFIPLSFVKDALETISSEKFWKERYYEIFGFQGKNTWEQFLTIFEFEFSSLFEKEIINSETGEKSKIGYDIFSQKLGTLLTNFKTDTEGKIIIKNFADSVLTIYQMAKYFAVEKKRAWNTDYELDVFYTDPENGYLQFYENAYAEIVQTYNKLRNYLTKKPYSEEKWKLNFKNPTLADGWDKNKESDNSAIILRKEGKYFLGLMAKGKNKIFDNRFKEEFQKGIEKGKYEKVVYKLLPGANKMLPKVFFSASNIDFYSPSERVLEVRNHASHAKNGTPQKGFEKKDFSLKDCHVLIDFFKESIQKHPDWKHFDFQFSDTEYHKDISDFYREVESGGYKISFQSISEKYIQEKNEKGELYLFQIKNKDWNKGSKGAKNLHTLYFESLFSEENRKQNFPMKLNGQAEIFYRPKTKDLKKEKITTKSGKTLEKEEKAFQKNRFTENKIFFHVPLTLNRTKTEARQFNEKINTFLANNPDINIIGVDRGEKHLAYYSVINQKSEILRDKEGKLLSGSLNFVGKDGSGKLIDYAEKLEAKAKNREQARKDWQTVEGIKDLKKGYISQVVRKLADLAIEHNAIIVLEDLNMRFKQIRGGIEKSIYQQLEKALIEKLNFLVNKGEKDAEKAGHLLKAYQLAAPFTTFQEMGKQTGILFYTQASYTSKIDPVSGWRPNLYLKHKKAETTKENILKFSKIEFANGRFEFEYDLKNFMDKKAQFSQKTTWKVCSSVERFRWNRHLNNNKGGYDHYEDLTDGKLKNRNLKEGEFSNFKDLFMNFGIDFERGDILGQIETLETKGNERFFKDFIFFFSLVCQIRNTDDSEKAKKEGKDDFILSPVEPFFDSRKSEEFRDNLPKNGDDNGAYNIARKGIILLQKINAWVNTAEKERQKYPDLFIGNEEWDDFARKRT